MCMCNIYQSLCLKSQTVSGGFSVCTPSPLYLGTLLGAGGGGLNSFTCVAPERDVDPRLLATALPSTFPPTRRALRWSCHRTRLAVCWPRHSTPSPWARWHKRSEMFTRLRLVDIVSSCVVRVLFCVPKSSLARLNTERKKKQKNTQGMPVNLLCSFKKES